MAAPNHDRVCVLANNALELLLDKQKHVDGCRQCPTDQHYCAEAKEFDKQFREVFATWRANRSSGGILTRSA